MYGHFWNGNHIRRITVAMLETEDCKCDVMRASHVLTRGRDRTGFYDKYGVLRDVFQNHLTEAC